MAEKPILFNTEMVRAILDDRKTQTRRVIKPHLSKNEFGWRVIVNCETMKPWAIETYDDDERFQGYVKPPFQVEDVLWVRETWFKDVGRYMYKANYSDTEIFYMNGREIKMVWRPSIHMPREAARLFLKVKDVRIERLQDMKMSDMQAEGAVPSTVTGGQWQQWQRDFMKPLWNSTIKSADLSRYGWDANPWVWVIEFERIISP